MVTLSLQKNQASMTPCILEFGRSSKQQIPLNTVLTDTVKLQNHSNSSQKLVSKLYGPDNQSQQFQFEVEKVPPTLKAVMFYVKVTLCRAPNSI
jgi:hypothetical protein